MGVLSVRCDDLSQGESGGAQKGAHATRRPPIQTTMGLSAAHHILTGGYGAQLAHYFGSIEKGEKLWEVVGFQYLEHPERYLVNLQGKDAAARSHRKACGNHSLSACPHCHQHRRRPHQDPPCIALILLLCSQGMSAVITRGR